MLTLLWSFFLLWFQVFNPSNPGSGGYFSGKVTLSSGSYTYNFPASYGQSPICVATDNSALSPVKVQTTTSNLVITGTSGDLVSFVCTGQ